MKISSRELHVEGNGYDIIEASMKNKNAHLKFIKKEYETEFDDYRKINEDDKNEYVNKKLGELPFHKFLQQLSLNELLWSYDANSFYPSAMSDDKSVYPRIETSYAFNPDMNDENVKKFNEGNFTQGSANLKI